MLHFEHPFVVGNAPVYRSVALERAGSSAPKLLVPWHQWTDAIGQWKKKGMGLGMLKVFEIRKYNDMFWDRLLDRILPEAASLNACWREYESWCW